ncbi:hypothetical protein BDN72DRAFT_94324 [Pluteus cervinus]|uniref:Uncharacterized protein n=1 Tax=Pluteus cervinus TaxID=181527 RepID=A0ACD3AQH7_9AGAR|nr:hypothetical protein BDN72DRAFT_94324 [Pluteus cervinus]
MITMSPSMRATIDHLMTVNHTPTCDNEIFEEWGGYENFMKSYGLKPWDEPDMIKGWAIVKAMLGGEGSESTSDNSDDEDEASGEDDGGWDSDDFDFLLSEDEVDIVDGGIIFISDTRLGDVDGDLDDEAEAGPGTYDKID